MEEKTMERDFEQEVRQLYEERPELRGEQLPEQVVKQCVEGKPLREAYADYTARQDEPQKPAANAPVKSVTHGGSVDTKPEDAFLRGFQSAW